MVHVRCGRDSHPKMCRKHCTAPGTATLRQVQAVQQAACTSFTAGLLLRGRPICTQPLGRTGITSSNNQLPLSSHTCQPDEPIVGDLHHAILRSALKFGMPLPHPRSRPQRSNKTMSRIRMAGTHSCHTRHCSECCQELHIASNHATSWPHLSAAT